MLDKKIFCLAEVPLLYQFMVRLDPIDRLLRASMLSDEDFVRLLGFVQSAFDLALHFIVGEEGAKGPRPEKED